MAITKMIPVSPPSSMFIFRSLLLLLFLVGATVAPLRAQGTGALTLPADDKHVKVSLVSDVTNVAPGQPFKVAVKLEHEPHWHTYGKVKQALGFPTTLAWTLPEGWKAAELPWPDPHVVPASDAEKVFGYEGTTLLPAEITPSPKAVPGSTAKIAVKLKGLVCDEGSVCMPITESATLELPVAATAKADDTNAGAIAASSSQNSSQPQEGILKLILFGFLGGLILNIMPCVFPVLGIKVAGVVQQSGDDKRKILTHGLIYSLGVLSSFWTLAIIFQALHAAGKSVGWGFQLQYAPFVFFIVLIMVVFGLNMAGLFEVGASAIGAGGELQKKSGLAGSYFSGLLATVVATPCAAPLLANALPVALGLPIIPSLAFFTVIGLGLASPYLVLSLFPSLLKLLPKPGAWMESFKQAMAFLMLGAGAYFAWVLMGLTNEESQRDLLIGLVLVALGCWIYGRWSVPFKPAATRVKGVIAAVVVFALGVWWAWPQQREDFWHEWSPELVRSLRAEHKPVYVDFTARWCATCQVNHHVYADDSLMEDFKRHNVVMLKADWTKPDDRISAALGELNRAAIPVNVLYIPNRTEPYILPNNLTVDNVKTALSGLDKGPPKT